MDEAVAHGAASEFWGEDERKRYRSADALKDYLERAAEITLGVDDAEPLSYLWSQLVSAALGDVDWNAVADHYLNT